jgi:hypothetical protein
MGRINLTVGKVKAAKRLHETGPWDEAGNLRWPEWIEQAGPMPATEPIWQLWAFVGKRALEGQ